MDFKRSRGNCISVYMRYSWIVKSEREREKLPRVFEKQQCLPHHLCSKFNVRVQHLTLLEATKAAAATAPPPHGEERVQPGGACCSMSVCTVNPNLPSNNFCIRRISSQSAPNRSRGGNRAPGECKLSCVVPLSVCVYCLPLVVCLPKTVDLISSEANGKIAQVECEMQCDLIVTSM
jgi:hypothetical protein